MTLDEARDELVGALTGVAAVVDELQVYGYWNDTPSPPALDVYPGTPFLDGAGMGVESARVFFTVRARAEMADTESGQRLLYRLLDPADDASVEAAMAVADWVVVPEGVSGFTQYADDAPANERLLGVEWRVGKFL